MPNAKSVFPVFQVGWQPFRFGYTPFDFFVLLLSFAKTESAKFEAALGSLRNTFGGNVLKHGEIIHRGKSADNAPL